MQKSIEYISGKFLTGLGMTVTLADGKTVALTPAAEDLGEKVVWTAAAVLEVIAPEASKVTEAPMLSMMQA